MDGHPEADPVQQWRRFFLRLHAACRWYWQDSLVWLASRPDLRHYALPLCDARQARSLVFDDGEESKEAELLRQGLRAGGLRESR